MKNFFAKISSVSAFRPVMAGIILVSLNIKATAQYESESGILERAKFEFEMVKDPATGQIPVNGYWDALLKTKQVKEFYSNTDARTTALSWIERGPNADVVGPSNGNTRANGAVTAGRMRAVLADAGDATGKTVWAGGIDGGLWKTADITVSPANWVCINDYLNNLAVTDICQNPANPDIMYFCTGEAYYNADAVAGAGVFKSTDHGATWSQLASTTAYTYCTRILCDNAGNVYLATRGSGLLRSANGGSTWTTITPTGLNSSICDMEISSTGRLHVVSGIFSTQGYRYTDIPSTVTTSSGWNAPVTAFPSYSMRAEIACSGNVLYACPADATYQVPTIYKSTDGGANWAATAGQPASGWASGQGWYSLAVGIDPSNSNNCIVGGLDNYKTTDGGATWTKISNWVGTTGQYVHADIHDIVWYDNGNKLLFACDGGIHYSADKGTTIRDRNTGLRIKQFYSVAVHPTTTNYFLGGTQDNGTHQLTSAGLGSSVEVTGGDGAFVAIDQDQPQYQFGAYVYNQYRRSTNGGSSWSSINFSSTAGQFINPFDYDDVNNKLYASHNAGYYLRWDNPQTGSTYATVSVSLFNGAKVSHVKVSPYTPNRVYFGTAGGRIIKADNANLATPASVNLTSSSMPAGNVSCINTGTSDQYLIASYSNYGVYNVWVSVDGGTSWVAVDGDLPNMPVRWCMFEPNDNSRGIIATETGVWETSAFNGASTVWIPSLNFPAVRTDMLEYRASDGLLAAGTHGRGIFTTVISNTPSCGTPAGLAATGITQSGATLTWSPVSGALNYDADYRVNGSATWINAVTGSTGATVALANLSAGTLYEWQVRANCPGASSSYATAQFTTQAVPTCSAPGGLTASNVTYSSATIGWTAVSGAASYDVDYKLSTSSAWINAATATTGTSVNLSSLAVSSTYDWQVRTNCTNGLSSSYTASQFTTTAIPACPVPSGLAASNITSGSATISWTPVSGAASYDAAYKLNTSSTWINAATATTGTSVNLSSLAASSTYDWQVRTNCTTGISGEYAASQFTTSAAATCPGTYDAGSNGTSGGAALIPFNTNIYGLINPSGDVDFYKFVVTTGGTATITLTDLPANYDLYLYASNGTTLLASSKKKNTSSESISRTYTTGTYYVKVTGANSAAWNATLCYTLAVQLGTATSPDLLVPMYNEQTLAKLYPNPASEILNISTSAPLDESSAFVIYDATGRRMSSGSLVINPQSIDISRLRQGVYLILVRTADGEETYRFVKE